jgi:RNA polymerase sigma factor (sigma-70 family)
LDGEHAAGSSPGPDRGADGLERLLAERGDDLLIRLLRQLPPRQRAVIVLRYWEQRPEAEVADLLGCTQGTVKSTANRGLRKLRELTKAAQDTADLAERIELVEDKS